MTSPLLRALFSPNPTRSPTRGVRSGLPGGLGLVAVALVSLVGPLVVPGAALAESGQIKLALRPVDQPGSYFDLTMRRGETRSLEVEIANVGHAGLSARTYAADVYTIINGGFGGRLRDEPQTGMTRWLDYPSDVLVLAADSNRRQRFTVSVPATAQPGEYISSLVLENDQPVLGGGGDVALNQIVRQAVAVVVTVPGRRSPALGIGGATHQVVAGKSVVAVAVENTGNVRLKPVGEFTLFDEAGAQVSRARVPMDTFYAHTKTLVEVPLAALLMPGTYTVQLVLDDPAEGVSTVATALTFVVEAPTDTSAADGQVPPLTEVTQGAGEGTVSFPVWIAVLVGLLVLVLVGSAMLVVLGRRRSEARAVRRGPRR